MLAKHLNDNAGFLNKRGACEFFASKLAPTESDPPYSWQSPTNATRPASSPALGYPTTRHNRAP
ncbi:hypothetical protein C7A12_00225 [Pseudomonas fluorescens]|nr:hypothetical protein C7A12_00225 [Pseudomonas fluorescens]PRW82392.1 hypothetical protein C7A13_00225 [Pseudomonas fluorescens]